MKRWLVTGALVVVLAAHARAEETQPRADATVYALLEAGDVAGAYAVAVENQRANLGDYNAEVELATAEISFFRYQEADNRLLNLIAKYPDETEPLRLQAFFYFMTTRRAEAWKVLDQALAIAPDDAELLLLRDEQKAIEALRQPPSRASVAPAARPVVDMFDGILGNATDQQIASHLAVGFGGMSSQKELTDFVRGARDSTRKPGTTTMSLEGFAIDGTDVNDAGDTVVAVRLLLRSHFKATPPAEFGKEHLNDAGLGGLVSPLETLPPHERKAVLARIAGYKTDVVIPLDVVMTGDDDRARIKEIELEGMALTKVVDVARRVTRDQAKQRLFGALKRAVPWLAGGALVAIILLVDWIRKRKRRPGVTAP